MYSYENIIESTITYLKSEWINTTDLPTWLALAFLMIIISIFGICMILLSKCLFERSNRKIPLREKNSSTSTVNTENAENNNSYQMFESREERIHIEARRKANEFSEAFKYLCTCIPGNKILARKPIRADKNNNQDFKRVESEGND